MLADYTCSGGSIEVFSYANSVCSDPVSPQQFAVYRNIVCMSAVNLFTLLRSYFIIFVKFKLLYCREHIIIIILTRIFVLHVSVERCIPLMW